MWYLLRKRFFLAWKLLFNALFRKWILTSDLFLLNKSLTIPCYWYRMFTLTAFVASYARGPKPLISSWQDKTDPFGIIGWILLGVTGRQEQIMERLKGSVCGPSGIVFFLEQRT